MLAPRRSSESRVPRTPSIAREEESSPAATMCSRSKWLIGGLAPFAPPRPRSRAPRLAPTCRQTTSVIPLIAATLVQRARRVRNLCQLHRCVRPCDGASSPRAPRAGVHGVRCLGDDDAARARTEADTELAAAIEASASAMSASARGSARRRPPRRLMRPLSSPGFPGSTRSTAAQRRAECRASC